MKKSWNEKFQDADCDMFPSISAVICCIMFLARYRLPARHASFMHSFIIRPHNAHISVPFKSNAIDVLVIQNIEATLTIQAPEFLSSLIYLTILIRIIILYYIITDRCLSSDSDRKSKQTGASAI